MTVSLGAPDQLSICMYAPAAYGGHARYTNELLSALSIVGQDRGVKMLLVTSRDLAPNYRTSMYPIFDILPPLLHRSETRNTLHWAYNRITYYIKRERAFLNWIERSKFTGGIHFQQYAPWVAPRHFRLLKARGEHLFFTVHNVYPHSYLPGVPKPLQDSWNRTAWRLCDTLFVHTEDLRNELAMFLGSRHPPIYVTPHGVWRYPDGSITPLNQEERLQRRHLLFFGMIRPNKGLEVLLRAMEKLPDYTLTVAGEPTEPAYQAYIRTLVRRLPTTQIELIDRYIEETEIPQLFAQSSLLVLPYTSFAAQSGVLHLAPAFGLPVVVTDVGTLGETVRRWGIGQVIPPNDDTALAGAIQEMFTPRDYQRATKAMDQLRTDNSWRRAAEITIEAYRSVLGKTGV